MKKAKILLFSGSFIVAILSLSSTKVLADANATIDCSVVSSKVCVTVENGPYTTTYYGKAKTPPPSEP